MNELAGILQRNVGQRLTPELVAGILGSYEQVRHGPVHSVLPTQDPADPTQTGPRLITNDKHRVAQWVAERIGMRGTWGGFGAIGQEDENGELAVGMVLTGMTESNANMHVAIADSGANASANNQPNNQQFAVLAKHRGKTTGKHLFSYYNEVRWMDR